MSASGGYPYHECLYADGPDGELVRRPCKHCAPGRPCAEARGTFDPVPGTDAEMFIQWKGTDVCVDFHCPCQPIDLKYSAHFDGYGAYFVRCTACGSVYEMGTQVRARLLEPGETPELAVQEMEPDRPGAEQTSTRPPGHAVPGVCAFGDRFCPCQDGDACHYVDAPGSPAMEPGAELFPAVSQRAIAGLLIRYDAACGYEGIGAEADPADPDTAAVDRLVMAWAREVRPDLTPDVFGLPEGAW